MEVGKYTNTLIYILPSWRSLNEEPFHTRLLEGLIPFATTKEQQMSNIKNVDENSFLEEVLNSEVPVLVDFNASWCAPCAAMEPVLEKLAEENVNVFKVVKVDIDDCSYLTKQYGVRSVPTFLVFKNGKVVGSQLGKAPKDSLFNLMHNSE